MRQNHTAWENKSVCAKKLSSCFDCAVNIALGVPCGGISTLIVQLFAFAQAQFHFYTPLLEIQLERHQCVPLQFDLLLQMANLAFMRQQAAGAAGIFIKDIPLLIWADVHAFQDELTIINICPGILQVDPAGTQAFDLGADQFNAGFQRFDEFRRTNQAGAWRRQLPR